MKKHLLSILTAVLAVVAIGAALLPQPAVAGTGTPVDITIALPGGATNVGSDTYDTAYAAAANSVLQPIAISWLYAGTTATNKTITVRKSATGPAWHTISHLTGGGSAAYKGVEFVTSEWYWLRPNDVIHVTGSSTNPCTVVIHCLER
jgi:hypothetical protein